MSIISKRKSNTNEIVYYSIPGCKQEDDCWKWIFNVFKSRLIEVLYITLDDLTNRTDEGSASVQLPPQTNERDFLLHRKSNIEMISITGRYEGNPVVIGVDLRKYCSFITIRNKQPASIVKLADVLHLS